MSGNISYYLSKLESPLIPRIRLDIDKLDDTEYLKKLRFHKNDLFELTGLMVFLSLMTGNRLIIQFDGSYCGKYHDGKILAKNGLVNRLEKFNQDFNILIYYCYTVYRDKA